MRAALKKAGLEASAVDYINAHGTSTMADVIELAAVERLMGDAAGKVTMSSTKSATGHLLGAAGAIEAIFSILAIRDQVAPPTINLDNQPLKPLSIWHPTKNGKEKSKLPCRILSGLGAQMPALPLEKLADVAKHCVQRF